MGVYTGGMAVLRIPEFYNEDDEWKVFHAAVHELVHAASHQDTERLGLHRREEYRQHGHLEEIESDQSRFLNEAITELTAFRIVTEHIKKKKTPLKSERRQQIDLMSLPYSEYIIIVKQIFSKIPEDAFIDAMLNVEGGERLRQLFEDAFGNPHALEDYGRRISNLYRPKHSLPRGSGPSRRGGSSKK